MLRPFSTASLGRSAVRLLTASAVLTGVLMAQQAGQQKSADLILQNGKILTVNSSFAIAQAVAIAGNQITAVGASADVLKLAGPNTLVIDLKGRTVIPGIIDTHRHINEEAESSYGGEVQSSALQRYVVDWRGVKTKEDVLNQIKGLMDKYQFKPGEWVYFVNQLSFMGGGGATAAQNVQSKILYDELNATEVDKVTPNNPAAFSMGIPEDNGLFINGKGMALIMAKHGDVLKKYGRFWIDATGKPDGHLEPPATRLVLNSLQKPNPEAIAPVYKKHLEEFPAMGITAVSTWLPDYAAATYQLLETRGDLTLRIGYGKKQEFGEIADLKNGMKALGKMIGTGTDKVWINSIAPSSIDGSGSRSCMGQQRAAEYGAVDGYWPMGQCHVDTEYRGAKGKNAQATANYYRDWIINGGANGVRFANTHVAGERSNTILLGMAEQVAKQSGANAVKGWASDHCTFVNPRDFKLAAQLHIIFSCAPKYIQGNAPGAAKAYGDTVANTFIVPVKSMLDAGVEVVFEQDQDAYTWKDIELLQTRKGEDGKVWGPQERVDRTTALKMATRSAADYIMKGDKLGSIEPGKWADLVVLDKDYMTIPTEQMHTIEPQLTVFDGKIIFATPAFSQEYKIQPAGAVVSNYAQLRARRKPSGLGAP